MITPYLVQRLRIGPRLPCFYAQNAIYSPCPIIFFNSASCHFLFYYASTFGITRKLPESFPKLPEHSLKVTENFPEHCVQHDFLYILQYFELRRYFPRLFGVKYALDTIFPPVLPYFHPLIAPLFSHVQHSEHRESSSKLSECSPIAIGNPEDFTEDSTKDPPTHPFKFYWQYPGQHCGGLVTLSYFLQHCEVTKYMLTQTSLTNNYTSSNNFSIFRLHVAAIFIPHHCTDQLHRTSRYI